MGADSAGTSGSSITIRQDEKVFENGDFLIGFTSSYRMGQLLRYKLKVPKQKESQSDMEYLVTDFIDGVRQLFKDNGFRDERATNGGTFLLGYKNNLYNIEDDFQVGKSFLNFDSVGCGSDIALGSLYSTMGQDPEQRIKIALDAACKFNTNVCAPYRTLIREY